MSNDLLPEVRARIDAHLDAVERQLDVAGIPREKRRGIVDDLETQILEMMAASGNSPVTLEKINELLSHLDPPEAYGKDSVQSIQPPPPVTTITHEPPKLCPQARQGIWWIALAILAQILLLGGQWVAVHRPNSPEIMEATTSQMPTPTMHTNRDDHSFAWVGLIVLTMLGAASVVAPIMGTSRGWIAVERIRNSEGKLSGLALASFEAMFYPLLGIWIGSFVIWHWNILTGSNRTVVPIWQMTIFRIGSIGTALMLSVILGWLLYRLTKNKAIPTR